MTSIYYTLTLTLILVHCAALSAFVSRWLPAFHIARAVGVLGVVLIGFFIEHFHGGGNLAWLWPLTTGASIVLLWHERLRLKQAGFLKAEFMFLSLVGYGLLWKWCFPSIYPTSERVTDLYFIGNYLAGSTLPPLDHWYPPHSFDFYYAFQHYAAALMGRLFQLSPGLTYNLALPLLTGLTAALAWDFATRFVAAPGWRALLLATLLIGGTGATPFVHLVHDNATPAIHDANSQMVGSARFIGLYDQQYTTDEFWRGVFLAPVAAGFERRQLPLEDFGYQYFIGDYHPPVGGFFLLALALALIGLLEGCGPRRLATAALGATVPLTIAVNTWVFPLQALLVGGWAVWRSRKDKTHAKVDWPALIAGGMAASALIYPFLAGFAAQSQATPIRWVAATDHTPITQFVALHWPLLLMAALGIAATLFRRKTRSITLYFALAFGILLFVTEMVFVDDPTAAQYERTNSVMKWWGWLWTGAVIALGSLLLGSPIAWVRRLVGITLACTCLYAVDIVRYFRDTGMADRGQLHGAGVYTQDATVRDMFRYLAQAPPGIVLENIYGGAYTDTGIYAAFAAKPILLGWPMHLNTWRGDVPAVGLTHDAIVAFYAGTLTDARRWLLGREVRYMVWNARDAKNGDVWTKVNDAIKTSYAWRGFGMAGSSPVGVWVRR